jgi:hypothetical protein
MDSGDEAARTTFTRFWEASERGDRAALRELVADGFKMTWPQSGERFRGADNAFAAIEAQALKPTPAGEPRILGCGDLWVLMSPLRYGEEVHHYVGVFELRDGLVAATTEYFGAPFPPQPARAPFAEQGSEGP